MATSIPLIVTDAEKSALDDALAQINATITAQNASASIDAQQPLMTMPGLVRRWLNANIADALTAQARKNADDLRAKFMAATPTQQAAALAALG